MIHPYIQRYKYYTTCIQWYTLIHTMVHTIIHTCIHWYIQWYIQFYIHAYTDTLNDTYIHRYIHWYIQFYIHAYTDTYNSTFIHRYIQFYVHTYSDIYNGRPTYNDTYIHTMIHSMNTVKNVFNRALKYFTYDYIVSVKLCKYNWVRIHKPLAPMAKWLCHRLMGGRYWVHISVPAPTQSGFLKAQRVGVRPLHPLLSHTNLYQGY